MRFLLSAIVCVGMAIPASGGEVADLIKKLPVGTTAERARIFGALTAGGDAVVEELVDLLGDEKTRIGARYALHGLAIDASRPGAEAERASFARALAGQIGATRSTFVNRILIAQLVHAGGPECASVLGKFVTDPELGPAACMSLVRLGDAGAPPLKAALTAERDRNLVHVVHALGVLRDRDSVPLLIEIAEGPATDLRPVALMALAEIGDPAAGAAVAGVAVSATGYEREIATSAWILLARRTGERGDRDGARRMYRAIFERRSAVEDIHARCAAVSGLAEIDGAAAMPEVANAQLSGNPELAAAATAAAAAVPGGDATKWWMERAGSRDPAARAGALRVLGLRKDPSALGTVREGLAADDKDVRLAAIGAAGDLGESGIVPALAGALDSKDAEERSAVRDALVRLPRGTGSRAIAGELAAAAPAVRGRLIEVLGLRGATVYLDAVVGYFDDADPDVRRAALDAAGKIGGRESLSRVVSRVMKSEEESERDAARNAFGEICRREVEREVCAAPVLAALPGADPEARAALFRMLASAGGDSALKAVRAGIADSDPKVKEAAVRALGSWPTEDSTADLLAIAGSDAETKLRVIALRGYVRQVEKKEEWWEEETVEALKAGLEAAPRPADKKKVLAAVGRVEIPSAIALAETALADEDCHAEAAAAMVNIAWETYEGRIDETVRAMKRLRAATNDKAVVKKAEDLITFLKENGDYVAEWKVSGPHEEPGVLLDDLVDFPFAPEKADADDKLWRDLWGGRSWWSPSRVEVQVGYAGNFAAYLRTHIRSEKARTVRMEVGSDDAIKVWINGEVVHSSRARGGESFGVDRVNVNLREGWNEVMVKVIERTNGCPVSLRFRSRWLGRRIPGLEVDRDHEESPL